MKPFAVIKRSIRLLLIAAVALDGCTSSSERALHRAEACVEALAPGGNNGNAPSSNDPARIEKRFAALVDLLETPELTPEAAGPLLSDLLRRTESDRERFRLLRELCEKYLYSPESPLRNDELYRHALEPIIASAHLDDYEKLRPRYQLGMTQRNGPGTVAADFTYTTADGMQATLHDLAADYTLLYFNNPDCPTCEALTRDLQRDRTIGRWVRSGRLRVLALYSNFDEEVEHWRAHAAEFPAEWIVAYDDGARICYEGLYDLRAVPCLYLLDAEKRVLVKGAIHKKEVTKALRRASKN